MPVAILLLIALFSCVPAYAQSGTGEIWGRVITDTGEIVDDASVTLANVDTRVERKTRSDDHGRFAFPDVGAGRYQVTAEHDGLAGRRQDDIILVPAQRLQIELPLRRAPMPETIALNPYPPIAESARTHASAFVAETEMRDLPVLGRRYLRLAEMTPGVSTDPGTGGVSVMNLPSSENRLVIDGFDHTSSMTGEPMGGDGPARMPYQVSQESIEGFRIETTAAPATAGGAAAATFDVVTRSGGNSLHGSAYEFFGDRALNAERAIDERAGFGKFPYRHNQFGATVGGPISTRHDFFFLSYDGLRHDATVRPGESETAGFTYTGVHYHSFLRDTNQDQNLLLARTDHHYAGQHLALRYMDQRYDGDIIEPTTTATPSLLRMRSGAARLSSVLGGFLVNDARVQFGRSRDEGDSELNLYGQHRFDTERVEAGDSLSWVTGAHSLTAGADMVRDRNSGAFFPRTFPIPLHVDVARYAAFAQDAWRATSALTVDLGVRYDVQDFNGAMPRNPNNWAPRLGFAFAPGERKSVFRAAYGLFYGSTPALIPALRSRSSSVSVDPTFKTARVHQASAGWEIEKYRAGFIGVDYLFARGERLPRAVVAVGRSNLLVGPVVSLQSTGESIYNGVTLHMRARVLQQLFYTIAYTVARSDETPLQPLGMPFLCDTCERRLLAVDGSTLQTRYPGNNDQHQRLTISAMYDTSLLAIDKHGLSKRLLKDWEYSVVYTWHTGNPYTAYGGDLNGDGISFNDVAAGTTWNQFRLPYYGSLDPRVTRHFRIGGASQLSLIWEAFNLTNRPNYIAVDNLMSPFRPNPQFGTPAAQLNGRVMQLAARFAF